MILDRTQHGSNGLCICQHNQVHQSCQSLLRNFHFKDQQHYVVCTESGRMFQTQLLYPRPAQTNIVSTALRHISKVIIVCSTPLWGWEMVV